MDTDRSGLGYLSTKFQLVLPYDGYVCLMDIVGDWKTLTVDAASCGNMLRDLRGHLGAKLVAWSAVRWVLPAGLT